MLQDDQDFWNLTFGLLFLMLFVNALVILHVVAGIVPRYIPLYDFALLALATFRLTRLFVYDKIMQHVRDLFLDKTLRMGDDGERIVLRQKPFGGPRRTIADLLSCPWCIGMWFALFVSFFYFLTPYAWFPILFLAIAGVASFIQVAANLIGWKAELLKMQVEDK